MMSKSTDFDKPEISQTREEAENAFLAFEGYKTVTQESVDGLVRTIMGSVDKGAIREATIDSILPQYLKRLSEEDVQNWVKRNFVKDKYRPIHENRMRILEEKAKKGDKVAILLTSMFREESNLPHYDIVDRWAHIKNMANLRLTKRREDIKGEHGTVTFDDWNAELEGELSELVETVNEEVQDIREKLDEDEESPLKQEFEIYVQNLREKRKTQREQYLVGHNTNIDRKVQYKLEEVERGIGNEIDRLTKWQEAISSFYKAKKGRFGPEAITIPNNRQMEPMDLARGFSGQIHVDQETGDLTLDLSQTGNIFSNPPEFSGLRPDGLKARMEFKAKEIHGDGQEEEYMISLGFDDKYGLKPYLQFICTETGQVSDKIYFGPDTSLDMTVVIRKPVIYLYSDEGINTRVRVDYDGRFTTVYPDFTINNEWSVKTLENGLIECLNKTYPYLFWEGIPNSAFNMDFDEGFCIKRANLKEFLENKLSSLSLNAKEQTDFITYWLPVLERNEFNLIQFCVEEYEEKAKLIIEPKPNQLIRVFMKFKAINSYIEIKEQKLTGVQRRDNGFVVVEWGGVDLGK